MTTLITNIKGELAVKSMFKAATDEIIFIRTNEDEKTELDKLVPVRYETVRMNNINHTVEDLARIIKSAFCSF